MKAKPFRHPTSIAVLLFGALLTADALPKAWSGSIIGLLTSLRRRIAVF